MRYSRSLRCLIGDSVLLRYVSKYIILTRYSGIYIVSKAAYSTHNRQYLLLSLVSKPKPIIAVLKKLGIKYRILIYLFCKQSTPLLSCRPGSRFPYLMYFRYTILYTGSRLQSDPGMLRSDDAISARLGGRPRHTLPRRRVQRHQHILRHDYVH